MEESPGRVHLQLLAPLLIVVELAARREAVKADDVHLLDRLEQPHDHDKAGCGHLMQSETERSVSAPVGGGTPCDRAARRQHRHQVVWHKDERREHDVVPRIARRQPRRLLRHLDRRDVVPLHHVAPERCLRSRMLLEALRDKGVEAHDRVEGVNHATEAAFTDRRPVAHKYHAAQVGPVRSCAATVSAHTAAWAHGEVIADGVLSASGASSCAADRACHWSANTTQPPTGAHPNSTSGAGRAARQRGHRPHHIAIASQRQRRRPMARRLVIGPRVRGEECIAPGRLARAHTRKLHNAQHDNSQPERAGDRPTVKQRAQ
mmetsp:Transcript_11369/g.29098  ORF Transcript_11369/g.29098 Transcript_11369/m.29098 type:complete len:319 (+) Transcript_11369:490-1446(+)